VGGLHLYFAFQQISTFDDVLILVIWREDVKSENVGENKFWRVFAALNGRRARWEAG
jgi:hypothetical protein